MESAAASPALTVAIALLAGVLTQGLARHLRVPGIVLLLAAGVVLGPDVLGIVQPATLGRGLQVLVGVAVAIILFEGGLNLKIESLRRQGTAVQRLLTIGAMTSLVAGTLAARWILGWDWRPAILFGALVIVTGPTVVTPLLRRVRVRSRVQTILEGEGVLIDAIGAVAAVVILEVVLHPGLSATATGAGAFAFRFGVGVPMGVLAGLLIAGALRYSKVVPEGLENVFALSVVLATYQVSESLLGETGIVAVVAAGLVVGNLRTRVSRELAEFKEQLTVMLIGLLFVLLAANVRIEAIVALGWRGLAVVAVLMWVARPLSVALCTAGTELAPKERVFVAWVAPRGVVAAAVASLFADQLGNAGLPGGPELVAMVFLVIAVTVTVQGVTMKPVAWLLGVLRPGDVGYAILGANGLGLAVGAALRDAGEDVIFLESNADKANHARSEGYAVVYGNGLEERVMRRAQPETRAGAIAVTPNEEANFLFAKRMHGEHDCPRTWVAIDRIHGHLTAASLRDTDIALLAGRTLDIDMWAIWLERERATVERWQRSERQGPSQEELAAQAPLNPVAPEGGGRRPFLPLVHVRHGRVRPWDGSVQPRAGDIAYLAIDGDSRERAEELLREKGWERAGNPSVAGDT